MSQLMTRRERVRAGTVAEIKELAWQQLATTGPLALSLRAIAREMQVTSSALYRYFPSREALLAALVCDGFASLADALEEADEQARAHPGPPGDRWLRVAGAHRRWALAHPTAYSLVFGSGCDGYEIELPAIKEQMFRGAGVLFRVMIESIESGECDPSGLHERLTEPMRAQLAEWRKDLGVADVDLDEAGLSAGLFAWTALHGAVALELFEHLPPQFLPADAYFDQTMRYVLEILGCRSAS
ncbi:MAG: TetR/AcrR family transcriptional regulator [Acidobacteriota bacterium]|nr:TetR/AcrR family transcriptional regulator [Acidobacteriota bacterium]